MSTLLQEIYQILHIRRIRKTPYHPQIDGLVELEWVGPYKVIRQVTPVDYENETPGRRKGKKIYHIICKKNGIFPLTEILC